MADGAQVTWREFAAELALAVPATATVLLTLFLVEEFTHQRTLFASLAASAFLVYHDPSHQMNTVRAMLISQVMAAALGIGAAWLVEPGYAAAALALASAICVLVFLRSVHPPALAPALGLGFSAEQGESLLLFMLSVLIAALLVGAQAAMRSVFTWVGRHRRPRSAAVRQVPHPHATDAEF